MLDSLGDRMKRNYELEFKLTRRTPVIIRVDGRAFHTFTKGFNRPFDKRIMLSMFLAASALRTKAQGCKLVYIQSDEISLFLTDYDTLTTEAWFDYKLAKLCSVSASIATVAFNKSLQHSRWAEFDARAFNIPESEVANYFLWRAQDWHRNSITMYTQSFFSHKQMHGKSCKDMHEMLHSRDKNWTTDLTPAEKNGTFFHRIAGGDWRVSTDTEPNYDSIAALL